MGLLEFATHFLRDKPLSVRTLPMTYDVLHTYLMRYRELLSRPKECRHHRMLRVRVNACARIAEVESVPEQWGACGLLQPEVRGRCTQEDTVGVR